MTPDDLTKLLDALTARLGPTGQHVFDLAVRQVILTNALSLLGGSAAMVLTIILARVAYRLYPSGPWDLAALGSCVAFGVALLVILRAVVPLLNPEYAAIQELLRAIR